MTTPRIPWEGSDRAKRLPANWQQLRRIVIERAGGRCQDTSDGARCTQPGTDVDHINPGDDHSLENLQLMCNPHHLRKTQAENTRRKPRIARHREPHPGLLP